jgi:DNA primase
MAGRIPQHFIDELLARTDIVAVIEERVPLRKAGREYTACCPFHNEKTPSFTVSPDKQFYHCFGCGAHGSAISFLMEYDRLEFVDAIEELAQRAGLQVPREAAALHEPARQDSLSVLEQAARYFRHQLKHAPDCQRAIDYLKQRGLSGDTAACFGLGYAPAGWDNLIKALQAKKITQQQMQEAGLIIKRDNGGYYDRFRDRIMFPIRDRRGRVIAFGGRVLGDDTPKYLNSPETALFHKGKELYGLYEARQANRQLQRVLVVEGYMDVVSLAQYGITYAVATLGTATTQEHLEVLFRAVSEVVFCFDGDRAGRQAAWRALTNALPVVKEGRQISFMFLPQGEDPDTMVQAEGKEQFEQRLQQATPFSRFFFDGLSQNLDLDTIDGRSGLVERARPLLLKLTPGVYQQLILEQLAEIAHMSPEKLSTLIFPTMEQISTPSVKPLKGGVSPLRQAIRLLLEYPQLAQGVDSQRLSGLALPGSDLLMQLLEIAQKTPHITCGALIEHWRGSENGRHLAKLLQIPITVPEDGVAAEFADAIQRLADMRAEQRIEELLAKSRQTELSAEEKRELNGLLATK